jgi:hypothetical protein
MKKLLIVITALAFFFNANAQYFQGSFTNTGNKLSFKLRPTADITTSISYLQVSFRYNIANTPLFAVNNLTSNGTNFPSLAMARLADYSDGTYNYLSFVHNTATIASKTYTSGTEYEICSITLDGAAGTFANIEMASDLVDANYVFGVVDGGGNFFDPGTSAQLYGSGFYTNGNGNFLPLNNVPLPVKFLGFNATKNNNSALLSWQVENEGTNTDHYEIEVSNAGVEFNKVATVASLNNGRGSNTYAFTQENLTAIRNSGVIYFRIKQIDRDGKFVYSQIRSVRLDGKSFGVSTYPNPTKNFTNLVIDLDNASIVNVTVTDAAGKLLSNNQFQGVKGANFQNVNLANYASGNYVIKVQAGAENKTIAVVKNN